MTVTISERNLSHPEYPLEPEKLIQVETLLDGYSQEFGTPWTIEKQLLRIGSHLSKHERVIAIRFSEEYQTIVDDTRKLSPEVRVAKTRCIDGREQQAIQDGGVMSGWSIPGGVPRTFMRNGIWRLSNGRLENSIRLTGRSGVEILELMKVHSSASEPVEHGCAALKGVIAEENGGMLPPNPDIVGRGLSELRHVEPIIKKTFNTGRIKAGLPALQKVTVLGVSDTDRMGLILQGNDEDYPLSTTDLAAQLLPDLLPFLETHGLLAKYRSLDISPEKLIEFERDNYLLVQHLMEHPPFVRAIEHYIHNSNLHQLTEKQRRGLLYAVGRNQANQFLTGLFREETIHHPFSHHGEKYASISSEGFHIGHFDPSTQVLRANPTDPDHALEALLLNYKIMDATSDQKPHIVYLTTSAPVTTINERAMVGFRGQSYSLFNHLVSNPEVSTAIQRGNLLLVPVILDEDRRLLEIYNPLS